MATRRNNDVTLPHELADKVSRFLSDRASELYRHAGKTRSAAVRDACKRQADDATAAARWIVERLYTWDD